METKYIQNLTDQDIEEIISVCAVIFDGQTIIQMERKERYIVVRLSEETIYLIYDYAFEGFPRQENALDKFAKWMTKKFGARYLTELANKLFKVDVYRKEVEEANARLTAAYNKSDAFVDRIQKEMEEK